MSTASDLRDFMDGKRPGPKHHCWVGDGQGGCVCSKCGKTDGSMPPPLFEICPKGEG